MSLLQWAFPRSIPSCRGRAYALRLWPKSRWFCCGFQDDENLRPADGTLFTVVGTDKLAFSPACRPGKIKLQLEAQYLSNRRGIWKFALSVLW